MSKHKQESSNSAREQKRAEFSDSTPESESKKTPPGPDRYRPGRWRILRGRQSQRPGWPSQADQCSARTVGGEDPACRTRGGKAKFFDYKTAENKNVRFFAMKSSDGVYRAALDSCDVCWEAKKGYVQDGDDMVCRKCGRHFHSAKINEVSGGCNPVPLTRSVADGHLVIAASDLEAGKSYF